jgi:hypothetical protein
LALDLDRADQRRVRRFIGRPDGADSLLLSDEDDPQLRWRFTDITPGSFRWRAESSHDAGATWSSDEEMLATRDDAPHPNGEGGIRTLERG